MSAMQGWHIFVSTNAGIRTWIDSKPTFPLGIALQKRFYPLAVALGPWVGGGGEEVGLR